MIAPADAREIVPLALPRPLSGVAWEGEALGLFGEGRPAWESAGGTTDRHPCRANPTSFEVHVDANACRVHLVGVFARFAELEAPGFEGARLSLAPEHGATVNLDLVRGRHYGLDLAPGQTLAPGDATEVTRVGEVEIAGATHPVDLLTLDLPNGFPGGTLTFRALGGHASFVVFDVLQESLPAARCPFHSGGGTVGIEEVGPALKRGDRVTFDRARRQFAEALTQAADLDEARGQALVFLAAVIGAMLELGGSRELHREILDAARRLDDETTLSGVLAQAEERIERTAGPALRERVAPSDRLVDKALAVIERQYARDLTDVTLAAQLGLSTSHFRHLFRQTTGQPFHRYLVNLRLEKAYQMLRSGEWSVSAVAKAVGFGGLSHFSRAFAQRFKIPPTAVRRSPD